MKTKITKDSRNLLIALLLGDGTVQSNNVFKLSHCIEQKEYLEHKIQLLNNAGIRNNGLKQYVSTCGYNTGRPVVYSQMNIIPFIKVLRKVFYKPKKDIANRKMLNRLTIQGVALWYMDDGHISYKKRNGVIKGFYVRISTCISKPQIDIIIKYFKEVWDIQFYSFKEGTNTFSLCCGTKEGKKFIKLIEPHIIPSMSYKIGVGLKKQPETQDKINHLEDIV